MINVGVIGTGHFGKEHARVYRSSDLANLVAVCDTDEKTGRARAEHLNVPFEPDFRKLIGKVDAVSLAVPTDSHHRIACELIEAGISVLVEKPMARTLDEADEMIALAQRRGVVLQVGHLERFNPAVIAATKIVTRPGFFEADRLSLFTPRSLDIDVVMDLMIHDIDIVLSLVKCPAAEIRAAGVPVITPRIDIANARIEFTNGCVANLTASRVSGERVRKLRFFQPNEYVSIDYSAQEAATVSIERAATVPLPKFNSHLLPVERDEPLRLEIQSFLAAVSGTPIEVTGTDGRNALELALGITQKIDEHLKKTRAPYHKP
jgi:predicted dehydrogenase